MFLKEQSLSKEGRILGLLASWSVIKWIYCFSAFGLYTFQLVDSKQCTVLFSVRNIQWFAKWLLL